MKKQNSFFPVRGRLLQAVVLLPLLFVLKGLPVHAAEENLSLQFLWEYVDPMEYHGYLEKLMPEYEIDLEAILELLMKGELGQAAGMLLEGVGGKITTELTGMSSLFTALLTLGILSGVFANFSDFFKSRQISDISFYILYLLLITVLMTAFLEASDIAVSLAEHILLFMKLFLPAYAAIVGVAVGASTAAACYQYILIISYGIEHLIEACFLPLIHCYVLLAIFNGIWMEERFSLLLELLKKGVSTGLKLAVGLVTSFGFLQSLLAPVLDSLKHSAWKKTISLLPGVGGVAESVTEMVVGTAVLLKNSLGIFLLLLLVLICLIPIAKLLLIACVIKGSAALAGILGEKRAVSCINEVGDGSILLLKAGAASAALLAIMIGIAAYTAKGI